MQMATAYSVFANGGYRVNPWLITRVVRPRGASRRSSSRQLTSNNARHRRTQRLRHGQPAAKVTRSGTAHARRPRSSAPTCTARPAPPTIRKDAWFAGFQPTMTAVTWIGYDQPRNLGSRETGGGLACRSGSTSWTRRSRACR